MILILQQLWSFIGDGWQLLECLPKVFANLYLIHVHIIEGRIFAASEYQTKLGREIPSLSRPARNKFYYF